MRRLLHAAASGADFRKLLMPALSPTMTSGRIAAWRAREGARLGVDDVIAEIETDKATVDFLAVEEAFLARILVPAAPAGAATGGEVKVGEVIALTVEDAKDVEAVRAMPLEALLGASKGEKEVERKTPEAPAPVVAVEQKRQEVPVPAANVQVKSNATLSPAARALLGTFGVDSSSVIGTGRGGKVITKEDALLAIKGLKLEGTSSPLAGEKQQAVKPLANATVETKPQIQTASAAFHDEDLSTMRKVIAQRLTESKQEIPHYYISIDADINKVLSMRSSLKKELGTVPSVNDYIVKAVALSLRDVPALNTKLDSKAKTPVNNTTVDISVAVATPNGLITPIIKNANQKTVYEISAEMKDLANRAKLNKLKLDEFQGGSFTISNLGMFGVDDFTAVINLPQAAIMAVGGGVPGFQLANNKLSSEFVELKDLRPVTMMTVSLSCDRRIIEETDAARFLQVFQKYMSNPNFMI